MHPALEALFSDADRRYLTPEELKTVGRYAVSLPQRLALYRKLRDNELRLFQSIADQMEAKLGSASGLETGSVSGTASGIATEMVAETTIEASLQAGILAVRNCAMAILLQDDRVWQEHVTWFRQQQAVRQAGAIDGLMLSLLVSQLQQVLGAEPTRIVKIYLDKLLP
jgi:hypothetical protein